MGLFIFIVFIILIIILTLLLSWGIRNTEVEEFDIIAMIVLTGISLALIFVFIFALINWNILTI